jgi:serine/threonine protein kinase
VPDFPDLGRQYEVLAELGRGTSGVVYKARMIPLNRLVSVKVSTPPAGVDENSVSSGVFHEASVLAQLATGSEPNVPTLHEVSGYPGGLLFVREFVEGDTLSELVSRSGIGLRELVGVLAAVCRVVGRIHTLGAAHRNLSPANVLVANNGTAKLIGFGRVCRLATPETVTDATADATAKADVLRLQQLLAFCCRLLRQPLPVQLQALCPGHPVTSASAFAVGLEYCRARVLDG